MLVSQRFVITIRSRHVDSIALVTTNKILNE
jgi:hypothetical protein